MKIKYEDLVLTGEDAPCYSVEDNKYIGYIVAKGTLAELAQTREYQSMCGGTIEDEPELYPPEFVYVVVMEDMDDEQDDYCIYNYDCDPCGVYAIKDFKQQLEEEDITLDDINNILTDFNALPVKLHDGPDSFIWLWLLTNEDFQKIISKDDAPITNTDFYESRHCGCEHDCCGCVSSRSLKVINNDNGWISIFFNVQLNY